jgi:outer membrane protein OmpA-like peptidoglycan-associated protein
MSSFNHRAAWIGTVAAAAALLAGCGSLGPSPGAPATEPSVPHQADVAPAALLAVLAGAAAGPALAGLVTSTARPDEDIRLLQAGTPGKTILASDSPAPAATVLPGQPLDQGGGQTDYQKAQFAKQYKAWQVTTTADLAAGDAKTSASIVSWLASLHLAQKFSRLDDPLADQGSLAAESAVAANAAADLEEEAGNIFGHHRVVLLYTDDLTGTLPSGELTGDDVIVVTSYLVSAAAASTAQVDLLGAGAAQAAVVGPEITAGQLARLVSADLSAGGPSDSVAAPVYFGNGSYALSPAAVVALGKLLPGLREPGVTAVISGYASTPGTAQANYALSFERATAVARWLVTHGVPEAALVIVGHGASDAVGPGASGANRRVLVVIEKA